MDELSHDSHFLARVGQCHQHSRIALPHPHAALAVFATFFATFAASCRFNQPPSPMNPRIALIQNQKTAKTAMLSGMVNIAVTTAVNLLSSSIYLPFLCVPSLPPFPLWCISFCPLRPPRPPRFTSPSPVRHGRLTCDPPDAYSTGAIWDRLSNLSRVPPHERPPAPVMTTAADRPDSTIEEPPWLFAPS